MILEPARASALRLERSGHILWQGIPRRWKPWKMLMADLDGDSRPEVLVALHKSTRRFHRRHSCLFVYGFDGKGLTPRWLGSRLTHEFTDFAVNSGTLYTLETRLDHLRCLGQYRWNGFGFTRVGESGSWKTAKLLSANPKGAAVLADGRKFVASRINGDNR